MWIHTESGKIFYNFDQLRLWLVQTHNIARPEGADDLAEILESKGVAAYTEPVIEVPLAAKQEMIWSRIKEERDRRNFNGVLVSGKWFHTDQPSRLQHLGMVIAGAALPAINWKTMDGSFVAMTPTIATAIFNADFTLDITNFGVAEVHRQAMLALPDPTGYDFSAGWMPTFGE